MTGAYIEQLDTLIAQLNTSAAHRERVFLEERPDKIKVDLESAEKDFSQFASKNATIDISAQGRAMLEGAASLQGQLDRSGIATGRVKADLFRQQHSCALDASTHR